MKKRVAQSAHPHTITLRLSSALMLSIIIFALIVISFCVGFYGNRNYLPGDKTLKTHDEGMLNESYIETHTFPPLTTPVLDGFDEKYTMPPLLTYTDAAYTFQYPSDFDLTTTEGNVTLIKKVYGKYLGVPQQFIASITITKEPFYGREISLNDWFVQNDLKEYLSFGKVVDGLIAQNVRTTTIAGEKALYNINQGDPAHIGDNVLFIHKNTGYNISISTYNVPGAAAALREILASFKFTQ